MPDSKNMMYRTIEPRNVSNKTNNTIEKFTSGGVGSVFASTGLNNPTGLAFDSVGNLYVADAGNNTSAESARCLAALA